MWGFIDLMPLVPLVVDSFGEGSNILPQGRYFRILTTNFGDGYVCMDSLLARQYSELG